MVYFIIPNHRNTYHIYSTMLTVMYFIMSDYRVTIGSDLDTSQSITYNESRRKINTCLTKNICYLPSNKMAEMSRFVRQESITFLISKLELKSPLFVFMCFGGIVQI